jgi:transposase-like protein
MTQSRRVRKEKEWRERLARFRRAGLSVVRFCRDEGVSPPTFYAWRKRLAGKAGAASPAEETPDVGWQRHGPFMPLRVTGTPPAGSQVTVALRGGTRLEIPLADPSAARMVIVAIMQADAEQAGGRPC